jgi:hypothetical protein
LLRLGFQAERDGFDSFLYGGGWGVVHPCLLPGLAERGKGKMT